MVQNIQNKKMQKENSTPCEWSPAAVKNQNFFPHNILFKNDRVVNLKVLEKTARENGVIISPYVLNLKATLKGNIKKDIPNLLNLKAATPGPRREKTYQKKQESTFPNTNVISHSLPPRDFMDQEKRASSGFDYKEIESPKRFTKKALRKSLPQMAGLALSQFWNPLQKWYRNRTSKINFLTTQSFTPLDSKYLTGSAHTVSPIRNKFISRVREQSSLMGFSLKPVGVLVRSTPILAYKKKSLAAFLIFCLLGSTIISGLSFYQKTFDLKESVFKKANIAYARLNDAQNFLGEQNYNQASSAFAEASQNFAASLEETQKLGKITLQTLELMPLSNQLSQGPKILKVGEYLATAGEYLTLAVQPFQDVNAIYPSQVKTSEKSNHTLTAAILESRDNLNIALSNLQSAKDEINKVQADKLDKDIQEKINLLQQNIPLLEASLKNFFSFSQDLLKILGHEKTKRYLLLFQNNNEIRATGGFIGSYGLLDLDEGQIKKLEIDGIYNPDGQLLEKITPPPPIRFVNTRWHTRDANWFPDFPASAEKVAWFFEKTGEPSVDGVIAITPNLMVELLKLTGPIAMPEYETTIDANNFVMQTQKEVELEYDQELNQPKQFLADLAPRVLNEILNTERPQWFSLLRVFSKMLAEKHLLFYFFDPKLQDFVAGQNWDGRIKDASQDYFQLVNTNINGGKTDNMIKETINLTTTIGGDGTVVNDVEIIRQHTGNYEWPSINNIDYLRLYVPKGSELIKAEGFDKVNLPPFSYEEMQYARDPLLEEIRKTSRTEETSGTTITDEFGKTCFGNWISVKPQEQARVRFQYKLPFQVKPSMLNNLDKYTLLAQKQAGSFGSSLNLKIILPSDLKLIWQYPENVNISPENIISGNIILDTDKYFGIAVEKN